MTEKGIWALGIAALAVIALFCVLHHAPTELSAAPVKASMPAISPAVLPAVPPSVLAPKAPAPSLVAPAAPAVDTALATSNQSSLLTPPPPSAGVVLPTPPTIKTPNAAVRKAASKRVYSSPARKPMALKTKRLAKAKVYKQGARACELTGERTGTNVIRSVCFSFNSAKLSASSKAKLITIVPNLKADSKSYELSGFADSIGSKDYNNNLAQRRAQAVKRFLESKGVEAGKVTLKSYGSDRADSGAGKTLKSLDRRVDVKTL